MRDIITDVVRQTIGMFEVVTVEGTEDETFLLAVDADRSMFLNGRTKEPVADLVGSYGLSNLHILKGLLDSPTYRGDDATVRVKRRGAGAIEAFEFRDGSGKSAADYRTMARNLCPDVQRMTRQIEWEIVVEPQKAKVAEFSYMANLFKEIDGNFQVATTKQGDLTFGIGGLAAATHSGSLVFAEGVTGALPEPMVFQTSHFLSLLKIADKHATTVRVWSGGVLNVDVDTPAATYRYFLRKRMAN